MPKISLPAIMLPDIRLGDGKLRDMKLLDIDLRDHLPEVDLSDLHLPQALRDVSLPDLGLPELHRPEIRLADIKRDIQREAKAHQLHLPDVNLRDLDMDDVRALAHLGRGARRARTPWAWVTLAGLAGLVAGWWLSTSSVTGPKMRELADRARRRVAAWQGGGSEWDDATEERTRGYWSSEHGWRDGAGGTEEPSAGLDSGEGEAVGTPGSTSASLDDADQVAATDALTSPRRTRRRSETPG
jgi:hypothetical protein